MVTSRLASTGSRKKVSFSCRKTGPHLLLSLEALSERDSFFAKSGCLRSCSQRAFGFSRIAVHSLQAKTSLLDAQLSITDGSQQRVSQSS